MERLSFEKACGIIYKHFGRENVEQVWKPDGKNFYIVSTLLNGIANTKVMHKADILALR